MALFNTFEGESPLCSIESVLDLGTIESGLATFNASSFTRFASYVFYASARIFRTSASSFAQPRTF